MSDNCAALARWLEAGNGNSPNVCVDGSTLLNKAALHGATGIVRLLVKRGADVNRSNFVGGCPLHYSARRSDYAMSDLLLRHGARVDAELNGSVTPLMIAADFGRGPACLDVLRLLLRHGASLDRAIEVKSSESVADFLLNVKRAGGYANFVRAPRIELFAGWQKGAFPM